MPTIKILDPVSRIEGHLAIEITLDTVQGRQQVVDARATGTMFRGIERVLENRPMGDAPHITQRICGVCPVSHGLAAVKALENAAGYTPPANARIMRNLVLAADFLHSHLLHFYHLSLLDFMDGPHRDPWAPSWSVDRRLAKADEDRLVANYVQALDMRRKCHEMGALFAGRLPHPPSYVPGGFTATPRKERVAKFGQLLQEITAFIQNTYIPDVNFLAQAYGDYYQLGAGPRNLLAYGVFDLDAQGSRKLFRRGRAQNGAKQALTLDVRAITESVRYSWYEDAAPMAPAQGQTVPLHPKASAYSWLKAPRYAQQAYEAGSLARLWVNGNYTRGISVMDRHQARAQEALIIAQAMQGWLAEIAQGGEIYRDPALPSSGQSFALTEAPRGALGHWISIAQGLLSRYQIVTPTCWNLSPRDDQGVLGALEQALLGIPVQNSDQPIEVMRVIHSFDPCLACAVHVIRPGRRATSVTGV